MDKKTLAVLTAALFGLAACGSGSKGHSGKIITGGGGAADAGSSAGSSAGGAGAGAKPNTTSPDTVQNKDESDNTPKEKTLAGNILIYVPKDSDIPKDEGTYEVTEDLKVLNINNRSILLVPKGKKADSDSIYRDNAPVGSVNLLTAFPKGSKQTNDTRPYVGSGDSPYRKHGSWSWVANDLNDVTYGEIYDEGERQYAFVQGKLTPKDKMPKERGIVQYKGKGTHEFSELDEIEIQKPDGSTEKKNAVVRSAFLEADVDVKVDFGEKTVIGKITPKNVPDAISADTMANNPQAKPWQGGVRETIIKGTITDNGFKGKQYDTKTEVEGYFYGNNAEHMGGTYHRDYVDDKEKWNAENYPTHGVFGVKKEAAQTTQ